MVMEALPTPDAVGREFVRQYYTLLNQAPAHAHRFYNSNSYFVHGAMSKPAIGQRQIHQKIQQLNFRDCHAKISQVDSQATLGNGLVVQVSGELSNDGEPMRRFTQTFVLGTHSPRMYYVHNDIFRYQDMLLSDEEGESPTREEDADQPQDVQPDNQNTGNIQYFNTSAPAPVETPLAPNQGTGQNVFLNGTTLHNDTLQGGQTQLAPPQEQAPVINGRVVADDLNTVNDDYMMVSQTQSQQDTKSPKDKINRTGPGKTETENAAPVEKEAIKSESEGFTAEIQDLHITETSNEPKTYANLLKMDRMSSGLTSGSSSTVINRSTTIFNTTSSSGSGTQRGLDESPQQSRPPRGRGGPSRGNNRKDRSSGPSRSSFNEDGGTMMGSNAMDNQERRRNPVPYSDHHQLFMGNLPLDATEEELRDLFSKFGNIVDLRIHSKQSTGTKGPPGNRVPNYGFITFENPQSVQEVLNKRPICFPRDGGIKLNVEEKKTKMRSSLSSQGGGGGIGGGGGGGGGGLSGNDGGGGGGGGRGLGMGSNTSERGGGGGGGGIGERSGGGGGGGGSAGGGGGSESWSSGRAPIRGGPPSRGSRGGGARGNFSRDSRGPPPNQRSNFPPRR